MGELHRLAAFNLQSRRKSYISKEQCDAIKLSRARKIKELLADGFICRNGFWLRDQKAQSS